MADGEVKFDTKLDTSGLDKGLRNVKNKVNKSAEDIGKGTKATNSLKTAFNETGGAASSFASKMVSIASGGNAVAAGITEAVLASKKYNDILKETDKAYKVREKAENALQKAAENNPYLSRESVQRLKDYAIEIQRVSNFGDEGTIDVMAQLAASGRSESETMKLVGAGADYAAAKHISLESAVQNLNKTYGGLAGELGELFPEVKALTAEQLKNGKAVDIIAQKYKGFAKEAADSSTKAKNAFGGAVVAGISAAVLAAKKYIETLKQANEAYKVQEKAENALQKAAENNPYLNRESVQRLKDYASEIQSVSNFGDEGTIDVMAQLAASGRSESEIMKLVGAGADYAAAKHISLESAVQNLNKSYGGLAGELGELFPEVKALTAEQLKNGEAVDIIAEKYKGFAKEAADSSIQAKNSFGDFMESIGKIAHPTFEALEKKSEAFWKKWTDRMDKFNEALKKARETWVIGGDYRESKDYVKGINENLKSVQPTKKTMYLEDNAESMSDESIRHITVYLEAQKKLNDNEREFLQILNDEKTHRENRAKAAAEYATYAEKWKDAKKEELQAWLDTRDTINYSTQELKAVNDALKEVEKQEQRNQKEAQKTADDYAKDSNKKLQASLEALEVEAKAKGESVSAQDKYNVYLQSYIDLLTKTEGLIKEGYPVEQKRIEQLQEAKKAVEEAADAESKLAAAIELTQAATEALNSASRHLTPAAELEAEIKQLDDIKAKIEAMSDAEIEAAQKGQEAQLSKAQLIEGLNQAEKQLVQEKVNAVTETEGSWWSKYESKQAELLELKKQINREMFNTDEEYYAALEALDNKYAESRKQQFAELATEINGYVQQTADIAKEAGDLMLQNVQTETDLELAKLDEKYEKGEMSEEQYYEKQKAIKRKAAQEEYKIKMFQWTASMLAATANIAEGVSKAISLGFPQGLISGALVGAAGGVQLASIIASKPVPPQFYAGGIIGGANGATYGSDNTYIHARTGEMVLNAHQQRGLWDMINGQDSRQQAGLNLTVNNTQANRVNADVREQDGEFFIDIIDAHINKGFTDGTYDAGLATMNTRQEGVRIL